MRPQEINRNINLAFKRFSRRGNPFHFAFIPDGDVTPHLEYISDRWNCVSRIKFLLKVAEKYE